MTFITSYSFETYPQWFNLAQLVMTYNDLCSHPIITNVNNSAKILKRPTITWSKLTQEAVTYNDLATQFKQI